MPMIGWDESQAIGHAEIDRQHEQLFRMANYIHELIQAGAEKEQLVAGLQKLNECVLAHFSDEEALMREAAYPQRDDHQQAHLKVAAKAAEIINNCQRGKLVLSIMLMHFLEEWVRQHMQTDDLALAQWLNGQTRAGQASP